MKRRNIALTLMATFCFSGVIGDNKTYADNPFEKFIPRGKLLKKLKDEFTGEPEELKIPDPRSISYSDAPTSSAIGECWKFNKRCKQGRFKPWSRVWDDASGKRE